MERGAEMEARNRADGTDDVTASFGRWVGCSNAGDWDAVAAMITDEAELRDPTHLRPVRPPGFAPTGRPVSVDGASVLRLVDGRVASVELLFDTTDVARQLLAAPPAGSRLEVAVAAAQRVRARWTRRRGR